MFLIDLASYQAGINLTTVKAAGFSAVNIKLTQGTGYTWSGGKAMADQARGLGMGVCTFTWIDNSASGAIQAQYAYQQMLAIGGPAGMGHQVDCEDTASFQVWHDYTDWWQQKLGRHVAAYTGDWWWAPRGWAGANLTPYLWAAPNAGYLGSYPGDTSTAWHAGYGGWNDYSLLQYAVSPIANAGGGNLSKTAIRDPAVWAALTGEPVTLSDTDAAYLIWRVEALAALRDTVAGGPELGHAFPAGTAVKAINTKLDALTAAVASIGTLSSTAIDELAAKLATALVVSSTNPLDDAYHAALRADLKQALREGVG